MSGTGDPAPALFDTDRVRWLARTPIDPPAEGAVLDRATRAAARTGIASRRGYAPTPQAARPGPARALGLGAVRYENAGPRFGLGSFKALGGAYGVPYVLRREIERLSGAPATFTEMPRSRRASRRWRA